MKNQILKSASGCILLFGLFFTSCQKEEILDTAADEIIDKASFSLDSSTNTGSKGCFDLVFPVSFTLPDGTTKTVNSDDELKSSLKGWVNGKKKKGEKCDSLRPKLVLPVTVINEAGNTLTISTAEELKALRDSCDRGKFKGGHHKDHAKKGGSCFKLNFPITVQLPDSSTQIANNAEEIKAIGQNWKKNHPTLKGHPHLVFPLSVTKKDGTVVTLNSKEELKALRTSCE